MRLAYILFITLILSTSKASERCECCDITGRRVEAPGKCEEFGLGENRYIKYRHECVFQAPIIYGPNDLSVSTFPCGDIFCSITQQCLIDEETGASECLGGTGVPSDYPDCGPTARCCVTPDNNPRCISCSQLNGCPTPGNSVCLIIPILRPCF